MAAAFRGHAVCVAELLGSFDAKDANRFGCTALMDAAAEGELDCAQILLPHSDGWAKNEDGETAFDCATREMHWGCADLLAAAMSDAERAKLRKKAPAEVDLPRCRAIEERRELRAHITAAASADRQIEEGGAESAVARPTRTTTRRV